MSYSYFLTEVKDNYFNLNIPRYIDTFEVEEKIDLDILIKDISNLENEMVKVKKQLKNHLDELGL